MLGFALLVRYCPFYPKPTRLLSPSPFPMAGAVLAAVGGAEPGALCELALTSSASPGSNADGFALGKPRVG